MSDTFRLSGRVSITPPATSTDLSVDFDIKADIMETLAVSKRHATVVSLGDDTAETVNMADLTSAAVVIVKADQPVTVRLTTVAGAAQAIGGVTFMVLLCADDPATAVTLQRGAGIITTCRVVLAEA